MNKTGIRSEIHRLISSMRPWDGIEESHIRFTLDWMNSGCEIFRTEKPATPDTHLVSYFVVASAGMNRILLVDHKKAGLWLPPGGHVELDENPKETVRREAQEELGMEADFLFDDPLFLTVTKTVGHVARHTDVSLWYILKGEMDYFFDYDPDEFNQIRWFEMNEIPFSNSDPHMERFIQKMIQRFAEKNLLQRKDP